MAASKGMRSAGIKIEINGEKEVNAQIRRMQQEFKTLTKEIELTQSKFAGQRNTLQALEEEYAKTKNAISKLSEIHGKLAEKGEILNNTIARETAERDRLEDELKKEQKALEDIGREYGESSLQYEEQLKVVQKAQIAYDKQSAKVEDYTRKQSKNTEAIVQNEIATNKLESDERFLGKAIEDANNHVNKQSELLDENGKRISNTDQNIQDMAASVKALAYIEALKLFGDQFAKLKEIIDECVQSYANLETAVVSVTRTVNGLSNEEAADFLQELSREIPLSVAELGQIATQGGQYGISKEDLKEYTRIIGALVTSTNLQYADAELVAQLQGIMRTNVADYERFGSVLVDLGNNTRTTEKNIVNMAMRIAQQGKYLNLTEAEILGLADAIASTGGQAEGAGTAMNRFMEDLHKAILSGGKDLDNFARVAGVSTNEFVELFESDAVGAITLVLKGLDDIASSGGNIYEVFESIGATNVREVQNLKNLSSIWQDVADTVNLANEAWEENTALAEESGKAWETTGSSIKEWESAIENARAMLGKKFEGDDSNIGWDGTPGISWVRKLLTNLINKWTDTNGFTFDLTDWFFGKAPETISWVSEIPGSEDFLEQQRQAYAEEEELLEEHQDTMKSIYSSGSSSIVSQQEEAIGLLYEQTAEIREMYESTFDPMEKFSEKGQLSGKKFIKNLENNTKKLQEYSDNLVKVLNDPRVSEGLKEYLKGLDPSEAYKMLEDFANDKDGKIIESANEAMDKYNQAISDSSVETGIATGDVTQSVIDTLVGSDLGDTGFDIGVDVDDGIIKGMASRRDAVRYMANSIAGIIEPVMRGVLKINSPSKITEKIGEGVGEGLALGMSNMEEDVTAEAAKLAALSANVYDGVVIGLQNGFNASFNLKTKDYSGVLNQISRNTRRNTTVVVEKPSSKSSQSTVNDLERALVRGMLY